MPYDSINHLKSVIWHDFFILFGQLLLTVISVGKGSAWRSKLISAYMLSILSGSGELLRRDGRSCPHTLPMGLPRASAQFCEKQEAGPEVSDFILRLIDPLLTSLASV